MTVGTDKLISAKNILLGLSTQAKVFVIVGVLFVVAGAVSIGAVTSSNSNPNPSTIAASSEINGQSSAKNGAVLAAVDDKTSSQSNNDEKATDSQQPQQNSVKRPVSNRNTNSTGQSSDGTTQTNNPPGTPKPDYNLNDNWYLAVAGAVGPYNTCWPEPFTAENDSRCMGATMDFTGTGIAKTALTADDTAYNQVIQKAAAAHAEARKGGPILEATLLTEALCTQYSLSCGRL